MEHLESKYLIEWKPIRFLFDIKSDLVSGNYFTDSSDSSVSEAYSKLSPVRTSVEFKMEES